MNAKNRNCNIHLFYNYFLDKKLFINFIKLTEISADINIQIFIV